MIEYSSVEELGVMLQKVGKQLVNLLAMRTKIVLAIEEMKRREGTPLIRLQVEETRLNEFAGWAVEKGIDPNFARALFYFIIDESCKVQFLQLQTASPRAAQLDDKEYYAQLKENLVELTRAIAPMYDGKYVKKLSATHLYLRFEKQFLREVLEGFQTKGRALDLGCATGHKTMKLGDMSFGSFDSVVGYDISPAMIAEARKKLSTAPTASHISFKVADIEEGIPEESESVAFVLMNLGTASDMHNIERVLKEVARVLKPGGKAMFSFYNKNAAIYRWFVPWPVSLAAEFDAKKHCIEVHGPGGKIYPIYGKPYSPSEARNLVATKLSVRRRATYPTLSAMLPEGVFEEPEIAEILDVADRGCSQGDHGAYILIEAEKAE